MDKNNSQYETILHSDELDYIFGKDNDDFEDALSPSKDSSSYHIKTYIRYIKRYLFKQMREKMNKDFINIILVTPECPGYTPNSSRMDSPLEYAEEFRKQYPDKDIRILIPLLNINEENFRPNKKIFFEVDRNNYELERTSVSFEYYAQNKTQQGILYKFPENESNIQVYGIYSPAFSYCKEPADLIKIHNMVPFIKSIRNCLKKMQKAGEKEYVPDIVQCENIPFFLGTEIEKVNFFPIKVLQVVKDFLQVDLMRAEPFWAAINLADKNMMRKICRDSLIKKYVAKLFNLHNSKKFYQLKDCLELIYKNYYKFRKYVDKGDDIEDNIIFKRLNSRIRHLFPKFIQEGEQYYNVMRYSIQKADYWVTISKTYYKEIQDTPELSGSLYNIVKNTKENSNYISFGLKADNLASDGYGNIYQNFDSSNFRELRNKNKTILIKEFSQDRIKTNFIDDYLFNDKAATIYGHLDSFYESPLLFANPQNEIFANGIDVLFNTVLKLFELHKNIKIIIAVKDGLKLNYVKSWVDFLCTNKRLDGSWVFIDGEINRTKFMAGSDMILIPRRANMSSNEHYMAMHYGCVPVVSRSGILNDTIPDIFDDMYYGCGFKTKTSLITKEDANTIYVNTLLKALNLYQNNPNSWNLLVKNCLNYNSNWSFRMLERYNKIYTKMMD